jgi:branched-chain amino acid aminotransferase
MQFSTKTILTNHSRLAETDFNDLPFGKNFSDHMFTADYKDGQWENCQILPYGNIEMTPANMALHYGQAIFEGMKANINNKTGQAAIFRPDLHLERINRSLDRLGMPDLPADLFYNSLHQLLSVDKQWIPTQAGSALYLRPVVFATDEFLGVRASDTYKYVLLTGPTNAYYNKPIKLLVADKYVRAFQGGTGFAKCAGNYAATIKPAREAREKGFDQILWVDGIDYSYLQECGTMNIFAVVGDTVITPNTSELILAGITRDSLIALLKHHNYKVEERAISIQELITAQQNGELKEMFGTGTAAVVSHVIEFAYKGVHYKLPSADNRPISSMLKQEIENIRQGESEDIFNWLVPVNSELVSNEVEK